jgi:uncharacterized membrane protein/sporulation protein YlmC with PRC-barrel domain
MDFPINVEVVCSDGSFGKSTAVIVDPSSEAVTHIAVSDPEKIYTEYLVDVNQIQQVNDQIIDLKCTKNDVCQMEKFAQAEFLDVPYYGYDRLDSISDPMDHLYRKEILPEGVIAVSKGMTVEALDGFVGTVDELVIDTDRGKITHIVLKTGHIWGSAEILIPVAQIKKIDSIAVYLDRSKESIETLPAVQIRRHYSKKEINQLGIEILIWSFDHAAQAGKAFDHLKIFTKKKNIEIRNAAILEKDKKGRTKAYEVADLGPRRGGITGVIAGGLIGMLAGPGGAIVGAAAGAVTGRAAARQIDRGFSDDYLAMLKDKLKPDASGIVVLVESTSVQTLIDELRSFGGETYQQKITDGLVTDLID